jgi:hypothetical protein
LSFGSKKEEIFMYKCNDCGHVFERGEERVTRENHGFSCGSVETFKVCPVCGGNYDVYYFSIEDAEPCKICGFATDLEGYDVCEDCVVERINYENALAYMTETNNLTFFIFHYIYNMECPKKTTPKFEEEMRMVFLRAKVNDLATQKRELLDLAVQFIKDNDLCQFVEFLQERGDI